MSHIPKAEHTRKVVWAKDKPGLGWMMQSSGHFSSRLFGHKPPLREYVFTSAFAYHKSYRFKDILGHVHQKALLSTDVS